MPPGTPMKVRTLILVLGDQLDANSAALAAGDPARDAVLMIETAAEATRTWSHRQRIALFIAGMRHCRDRLRSQGWRVLYRELGDDVPDLATGLREALQFSGAQRVLVTEPGEWRVEQEITAACDAAGATLQMLPDDHFYCSRSEFGALARGRSRYTMEQFYRQMRRRHGVLLDDGKPCGGSWNFDPDNRAAFGRAGPPPLPPPALPAPDALTRAVLAEVAQHFPDHPGSLDSFHWPVTREQALALLAHFIRHRLPAFGRHQDAMWQGEPFLAHSLLASSLNLKLLDPREVVAAAERAYRDGHAPLPAAEGFIRQVLGWREYIRGQYWLHMPGYAARNELDATLPLPAWFWTGDIGMNCLRQSIGDTLGNAYAHHIQRLMVIGNFALLAGIQPQAVCNWFLAVYADAVEWVELPNTLGMALHADGGVVGTKPYAASGRYIQRMSNYCKGCRYDPARRSGDGACPYTVLYWDFLARHRDRLAGNPRMALALANLDRIDAPELGAIRKQAETIRSAPETL